jgi:hypothetical protein
MGCCGEKRAAAVAASQAGSRAPSEGRAGSFDARGAAQQAGAPTTARGGARYAPRKDVALRNTGVRGVRVRGTTTGRLYTFPSAGASTAVDVRDVAALLRTGLFTRS